MAGVIVSSIDRLEDAMGRAQVIADSLGMASDEHGARAPWVLLLQNLVGEISEAVDAVVVEARRT